MEVENKGLKSVVSKSGFDRGVAYLAVKLHGHEQLCGNWVLTVYDPRKLSERTL